ncbi:hypothetical protein D3P04_22045 [Paracoccus onubensis]|uniref:Uncharacterized protein n=1 Tax=Paracoccus onubensis TaxID=1675788 RepID=A0A418SM62_9RHOB|nr:hypothetical protein D3P04_22045 [Paracoccus onubensis]
MARQRQTTAEQLRVVTEPAYPAASGPKASDPRLRELVRLLARRAARDFIQAEERESRKRLPD